MHLKKFLSGYAQLKYPIMSLYKIALNDSKQNVKLKKLNIVSYDLVYFDKLMIKCRMEYKIVSVTITFSKI